MSRLERLLKLIDTGTSEAIHKVVATQIGDIQSTHPEELHNLLDAVGRLLLYSDSWETRSAAALALEAIFSNIPTWTPAIKKEEEEEGGMEETYTEKGDSPLQKFSLKEILKREPLTSIVCVAADDGTDFVDEKDIDSLIESETDKSLGLRKERGKRRMANSNDTTTPPLKTVKVEGSTVPVKLEEEGELNSAQSIRIKAVQKMRSKDALKTAAAAASSQVSLSRNEDVPANTQPEQTRLVGTEQPQDSSRIVLETVKDESKPQSDDIFTGTVWPLDHFGRTLLREVENKSWTVRHGAALGLRALLQERLVADAGKASGMTARQMAAANARWIEAAASKLLEVLARDRFSDFSSAQTVAPVRETCAQALGVLSRSFCTGTAERVLDILDEMGTLDEWIVRYSALLGVKYVIAVRQDLAGVIVPRVFGTVLVAAQDEDDDVRAVAAAALVPVADEIVSKRLVSADRLITLEGLLWKTLAELDEITSATAPVLELLSVLYANKESPLFATATKEKFNPYIAVLLPYINHSLENVRRSTLSMILK